MKDMRKRLSLFKAKIMHFFKYSLIYTILPSLYFNFHYLPFKQAVRLPILLYKPHFNCLQGKIRIESDNIYMGMIKLGFLIGNCYPNTGVTWYNKGEIVFEGSCQIGNNSHIVVLPTGCVKFGEKFSATTTCRLYCGFYIQFGYSVSLGWDVTIMDTNMHPICDLERTKYAKAYGKVAIGDYNWISSQSMIMHSVISPPYMIFAARSVITRRTDFESYSMWGGSPLRLLKKGVIRDWGSDQIVYKKYILD